MRRADLADWVMAHDCETWEFPEVNNSASVVRFRNKQDRNMRAYIDAPMDERPIKDYTVFRVCTLLGIPIPDEVMHCADTHEQIQKLDQEEEKEKKHRIPGTRPRLPR